MTPTTIGSGRPPRSGRVRKTILTALVSILVLAIGIAGYTVISLYRSLRSINPASASTRSVLNMRERINVLVVGVDSRAPTDPGRADSIILVGLDPIAGTVTAISIPRDTRLNVPGHGYDKINATSNPDVYSDGGMALLEKSIESIIPGIKINYYVKTDFAGFEKVIDALGGVTINVEKPMYYKSADTLINLKAGVQHMDGKTALEYARFRHDAVGDFGSWDGQEYGRVVRQKELLKAIVAQTTALRNVWKLPPVIQAVEKAVSTDLLPNDMLRIGLAFKNTTDKEVTTVPFPGVPGYVDGISYVLPDTAALQSKVAPLFAPALPAN
ncbi:MAG: LCP family protein [Candidatus Cryosericum sp.]